MTPEMVFQRCESQSNYTRYQTIYREIEDCSVCLDKKMCFGLDPSDKEYYIIYICLPCFKELIEDENEETTSVTNNDDDDTATECQAIQEPKALHP